VLAAADVTGDGTADLVAVEDDGTTRVLPGLANLKHPLIWQHQGRVLSSRRHS
jgi:hypothetical protein